MVQARVDMAEFEAIENTCLFESIDFHGAVEGEEESDLA